MMLHLMSGSFKQKKERKATVVLFPVLPGTFQVSGESRDIIKAKLGGVLIWKPAQIFLHLNVL